MASGQDGGDSGDDVLLWVGVLVGAMLAFTLGYNHFRGPINYAVLWVSYLLLLPVSHLSHYAQEVRLAMLRHRPVDLTWHQTLLFFDYTMGWWRVVSLPLFAWLAWSAWGLGVDRYTKHFGARALLEHHAKLFPVIAPALQRNFLEEPQHEGPWRMEETPIEWVVRRSLLVRDSDNGAVRIPVRRGEIFDPDWVLLPSHRMVYVNDRVGLRGDRLKIYLRTQLGPAAPDRFDPNLFPCGPPPESGGVGINYRRALATAFLLFALRERKDAYALLDTFSGSFRDFGNCTGNRIFYDLDTSDVDDALAQVKQRGEYTEIVQFLGQHNAYVNPSIAALLELARGGGELAPVRFLWLRAVDRALWCTLHQMGGRTAWVEAIASWSHMSVEHALETSTHQVGYSFTLASNAISESLSTEGWINRKREGQNSP